MKQKDKYEYDKWVSHLNNTKERTFYAIRRMDLLTISISGAGIYIIFEAIREAKTGDLKLENTNLLIVSGIAFLITILLNFASQTTGYFANSYEENFIEEELLRLEKKDWDKKFQKRIDKIINRLDRATDILNVLSVLAMLIGLFFLAKFNYHLF